MVTEDSYASLYIDLKKDLPVLNDVVTIESRDCYATLESVVKVPIRLPLEHGTAWDFLFRNEEVLRNTFIAFAKEMGVREVIIPRFSGCRIRYKSVGVDELNIRVGTVDLLAESVPPRVGSYTAIFINGIIIPLLWCGSGGYEYVNKLRSVLETAIFMNKNPWVVDVLIKTLDKLLGNSPNTYNMINNLHLVLKLIGAEIR